MTRSTVAAFALVLAACSSGATATTTSSSIAATTTTTGASETVSTTVTTAAEPSTTSTSARVDADSVAGGLEGTVGYVGCSMSQNSVEGYEAGGGTNMWTFRLPYGGGTIGRWNDAISGRGDYWGGFDKALDLDPNTSVIWWNLCTVKGSPQDSFENAVKILDQIENRIPGVEVYVSAQPPYADGHICALAGDGGPELMEQLAQQLIDAGLVGRGPNMGPLTKAETRDGCHANEAGQEVLGQQLLDFFG